MHDDRLLTERRLDRVLRERIRPAVYGATVPLQVAAWHVPGEPVPPAEGLAAEYRPAEVGVNHGAGRGALPGSPLPGRCHPSGTARRSWRSSIWASAGAPVSPRRA